MLFLRDCSTIVLLQQYGMDGSVTVFLLIAWNGKALSRPTDSDGNIEHTVDLR
jgi:hypothetical protein